MAFLSKYGVARHVYIPVIKRAVVDFAVGADWTPAAGDVKISKDGGVAANVTNLPAAIAMGNAAMWDFSLTATEMEAAQVMVTVADSVTKAVEDTMFILETYGNASGQHAADLDDGVRMGLTALPNATPGASGGLLIAGANTAATSFTAGVTISNAGGSALTLSSSGANGNGLLATGNGSADGIHAEGGATGRGIHARGGASGGAGILAIAQAASDGIAATGVGAGAGIHATAGATGNGMTLTGGSTSGHGLQATVTSGNKIDADLAGSVGSVAAGGITSSSIATAAIDADSLATDAVNEIADGVLDRNMATGTDSGSPTVRTVRQALRASRNKVSIAAGTATITKEDDTTVSWTAAVTTAAGDPISSIDPASI